MGFHCKLSPDRRAMRTRPKQDEAVDLLDLLIEQVRRLRDLRARSGRQHRVLERRRRAHQGLRAARDHRQAVRECSSPRTTARPASPAHILTQTRIQGAISGRGLARAQGRQPLLGVRGDHGAARRLRRAERVREDHARPDRTAAQRRGGAARGGGARRPPPGGAGRARGAAFARSAGPDPAQHHRGRDRAGTRRQADLRERRRRAAVRLRVRGGDAGRRDRRASWTLRGVSRGRDAVPAGASCRAGWRCRERRRPPSSGSG